MSSSAVLFLPWGVRGEESSSSLLSKFDCRQKEVGRKEEEEVDRGGSCETYF